MFSKSRGLRWWVVLGSHHIDNDRKCGTNADKNCDELVMITLNLSKLTIHPKYKHSEKYYDVGMVLLDKRVKLCDDPFPINTICFPEVISIFNNISIKLK